MCYPTFGTNLHGVLIACYVQERKREHCRMCGEPWSSIDSSSNSGIQVAAAALSSSSGTQQQLRNSSHK